MRRRFPRTIEDPVPYSEHEQIRRFPNRPHPQNPPPPRREEGRRNHRNARPRWFNNNNNNNRWSSERRQPPRQRHPPLHVAVAEAVRREMQPLLKKMAALQKEVSLLRQQQQQQHTLRPQGRPTKKQLQVFQSSNTLHLNEYLEITEQANKRSLQMPASPCTLTHVQGDLLASEDTIFMHAVAADMKMSRGFADKVRRKYPMPPNDSSSARLLQPGDVVHQFDDPTQTRILHVVTKHKSKHKLWQNPNQFLVNYLQGLRGALEICKSSNVTHLSMPRMGCNLDQLDWRFVEYKINQICHELKYDLNITVYTHRQRGKSAANRVASLGQPTSHMETDLQESPAARTQQQSEDSTQPPATSGSGSEFVSSSPQEDVPVATAEEVLEAVHHSKQLTSPEARNVQSVSSTESSPLECSSPTKRVCIVPTNFIDLARAVNFDHVYQRQSTFLSPNTAQKSLQYKIGSNNSQQASSSKQPNL
jgi:hypothetical protein